MEGILSIIEASATVGWQKTENPCGDVAVRWAIEPLAKNGAIYIGRPSLW
jgi:hypothetical protein